MTLLLCPECRAQVSDRAGQCPKCGYPLTAGAGVPVPAFRPKPPEAPTSISRQFARVWTISTFGFVVFLLSVGRATNDPGVVIGGLALLGTMVPIWWKTRGRGQTGSTADGAELERRVEARLQNAEEQIRWQLSEMEDGTRQIQQLEERLDFAERMLTKYRDEQNRGPGAAERKPE